MKISVISSQNFHSDIRKYRKSSAISLIFFMLKVENVKIRYNVKNVTLKFIHMRTRYLELVKSKLTTIFS